MTQHWETVHRVALDDQLTAADRNVTVAAFAKTVRLLLQSAILALGAYLSGNRAEYNGGHYHRRIYFDDARGFSH